MGADGGRGGLSQRLLQPARTVALTELPAEWFHSIVEVRCRGAAAWGADAQAAGKLRGTWGGQLKASASREAVAGEPCPWQPACAFDVFFRTQGWMTPGLEIPKPYALALLRDGQDLIVRLTLFGFASDWTEEATDALVRACRAVPGRLEVIDRRYWSEEALAEAAASESLVLAFETPLEIRHKEGARADAAGSSFTLKSLVATLANRVSGLARWQDAALVTDFRALTEQAVVLPVQVLDHLPDRWRRFSRRQGQWIPMGGRRLVVLIEGDLAPLMPLLAIGETCHAGSHASLGLGRYTMLVPR